MRDLAGKTAFITGGASGIGLAMGRACAQAGMQVMLADIEQATLDRAVASLAGIGPGVRGTICDVTDYAAVDKAAHVAVAAFGKVHLVCNNAGVGGASNVDQVSLEDWRWVIDVNLMGVVHGVKAFLPLLKLHGEGGHFVNTASMAGMLSGMGFSAYTATKFAVVGASEGLAQQLAPVGIGVSVLCPGWVRTRITESERNWPKELGPMPAQGPNPVAEKIAGLVAAGMEPADVARLVLNAVRNNELYVFTHPHMRPPLKERFERIMAAYEKLGPVPPKKVPS